MKLEKINKSKINAQEKIKSNSIVESYLLENKISYDKQEDKFNVKVATRDGLGNVIKFLKENKLRPLNLTRINEDKFRYKFNINEVDKDSELASGLLDEAKDKEEKLPDAIPSEPIVVSSEEIDEPKEDEVSEKEKSNALVFTINDLIQDEFEAIDRYNSAIITLESIGYKDSDKLVAILNDILNEENIHIGQLQEALMLVSPHAKDIEQGKEEAQEVIASVETPSEGEDIENKKEEKK